MYMCNVALKVDVQKTSASFLAAGGHSMRHIALMMEIVNTFETSVNLRNIPEGCRLHRTGAKREHWSHIYLSQNHVQWRS
jgi:hypothetical protein